MNSSAYDWSCHPASLILGDANECNYTKSEWASTSLSSSLPAIKITDQGTNHRAPSVHPSQLRNQKRYNCAVMLSLEFGPHIIISAISFLWSSQYILFFSGSSNNRELMRDGQGARVSDGECRGCWSLHPVNNYRALLACSEFSSVPLPGSDQRVQRKVA